MGLDDRDNAGVGGDQARGVFPSFDAVLAAARKGEGPAFEHIYESMNRRVYRFARARGAYDPEGLVNDVFLQVFLGLPNFQGTESQFNAWVFKIARNKLIDEARKRQRRPVEVSQDVTAAELLPSLEDVEAEVEARIGTESVLAHLDSLTEQQREVVLLRVVADLSIDTVAEILGKRPGAVKALQRRAFRTIARSLSNVFVPFAAIRAF